MTAEAVITLAIVLLTVSVLAASRLAVDAVLVGAATLLMVVPVPGAAGWTMGVLRPEDVLIGLSNPGVVTVAVLFVVAAGIGETGGLDWAAEKMLGRPRAQVVAQARMMGLVLGLSAFLNNTPVVALMIPQVTEWAKRLRLSVSKFMMPLSYAAILGGLCTLIGTSTNLVIAGLVADRPEIEPLGMFTVTPLGLPCALVGAAFLIFVGRRLLPDRRPIEGAVEDPREYTVEMMVEPSSPLAGKTIEEAGLRHLPGLYLMEIDRAGAVLHAVGSEERLQSGDRLVFVGVVESVKDLQRVRGLAPATDQIFKLDSPRSERCLIEAVVSDTCPMAGKSIREGRFRSVYDAAVIAVARNGQRLRHKIGDIVLRPGDTLMLETRPGFVDRNRDSRDFFLVGALEDSAPLRREKAGIALAILAALVVAVAAGWLPMLVGAMVAAGLMLMARCLSARAARRSVDWSVIIAIAAALALGRALEKSGAASVVAQLLLGGAGDRPWVALALVYLVTVVFTELLTNNAAAVLIFPIGLATAQALGVNPMPFVMSVMVGASAGFATPLGYQTNMMVFGPGGYRFGDFLRVGLMMDIVIGAVVIALAPVIWPFR
jgi:di/tricarboxylate transporter